MQWKVRSRHWEQLEVEQEGAWGGQDREVDWVGISVGLSVVQKEL